MGADFEPAQAEDPLFTKTLSKNTKKALALLSDFPFPEKTYLAGGTACALHLGHRISVDLDFFTPIKFDSKAVLHALKDHGEFKLEQQSWGTILGLFSEVKFSLFVYEYPLLFPSHSFQRIPIADLRDIAAMKIEAISSRGIKRDFMDLYFICQSGIALKEILDLYDRKYQQHKSNTIHILKSLIYFVDADATAVPKMLKTVDWKKVKRFFEDEVKNYLLSAARFS